MKRAPTPDSFTVVLISAADRLETVGRTEENVSTRYRIEIELTLEKDAETTVVAQARLLCISHGYFAAVDQNGQREITSNEFIDGPEQALLELLDSNRLFGSEGIGVMKMACGRVLDEPDELPSAD